MNRFANILSKSPIPIIPKTSTTPSLEQAATQQAPSKKLQKMIKSGPQLLLTRILMIHGPLQNKEIWRLYERMQKENAKSPDPEKLDDFKSLTHMKRVLKFMVDKEKIKTAGYDKKARQHKGWLAVPEKALKNVHPEAIETIQKSISSKDLI